MNDLIRRRGSVNDWRAIVSVPLVMLMGCQVVILILIGFIISINYDEAYNMQIVSNLLKSGEYASAGSLIGVSSWQFDPHITTGPIAIGIMYVFNTVIKNEINALKIYNSIVMISIISGAYWYYRKQEFRLEYTMLTCMALASVHVSLESDLVEKTSLRFVGEPLVCVWMFAVLTSLRNKSIKGLGIFVGLIIQTKIALGLCIWVLISTRLAMVNNDGRLRSLAHYGMWSSIPSILFGCFMYISANNKRTLIIDYIDFINSQRNQESLVQNAINVTQTLSQHTPAIIKIVLILGAATELLLFLAARCRVAGASRFALSSGWMADEVWLFWSLCVSSYAVNNTYTINFRTVMVLIVVCGPRLLVFVLARLVNPVVMRGIIATSLIISIMYSWRDLQIIQGNSGLVSQQWAANQVKDSGADSIYVDGWWQNPEFTLLTGMQASPRRKGRQVHIVQDYEILLRNKAWEDYRPGCGGVVAETPSVLACRMPDVTDHTSMVLEKSGVKMNKVNIIEIITYSRKNTVWAQLKKNDLGLDPMRVYIDGKPGPLVHVESGSRIVTSYIPALDIWGRKEITVSLVSTIDAKTIQLGKIEIAEGL